MIAIYLSRHQYRYEARQIANLFCDDCAVELAPVDFVAAQTQHIWSCVLFLNQKMTALCRLQNGANTLYQTRQVVESGDEKALKRAVVKTLFDCLAVHYKRRPAWGSMVGVRPTKLVNRLLARGYDAAAISSYLGEQYGVSQPKIDLLQEVCRGQRRLLNGLSPASASLYIGIPFCPTRCVYCSFMAQATAPGGPVIDRYLDVLIAELAGVQEALSDRVIDSVYIGGGTPAMLSPVQIDRLFAAIRRYYSLDGVREITFEAGRPELIDDELLTALKRNGVDRICINPQTMHDQTLQKIGRLHGVADVLRAFEKVKKYDFRAVNADVIAGLIGEDEAMFEQTIARLIAHRPANITVHTLALKRGAQLKAAPTHLSAERHVVARQLDVAERLLRRSGYHPYYLYRQKNTLGNLENVGYSLAGKDSFYNVVIIDESQSILAFGAGTTSKILLANGQLKRLHNPKDSLLYARRNAQIIAHKCQVLGAAAT